MTDRLRLPGPPKSLSPILLILLGLFGATACSYSGSLQPYFHLPREYEKLPLTVALVVDKKTKDLRFFHKGDHEIDIKLYPGVVNAVRSELEAHFQKVILVKDFYEIKGEDLYAELNLLIRETVKNDFTGEVALGLDFRVSLKEVKTQKLISEYGHSNMVSYNATAIGFPKITESLGREIKDNLKSQVQFLLGLIGDEISTDKGLYEFAGIPMPDPVVDKPKAVAVPRKPAPSKYEDFLNSVVVVRVSGGLGTGFFVKRSGLIITNYHVVESQRSVSISLRSKEVLMGEVIEVDKVRDLALITVEGENFPWIRLGTIEDAPLGIDVVAIGTPKGLEWSISKGIVSANRETNQGVLLIQTDTAINTGNSGGPLINIQNGRVIGVNSLSLRKDISEGLNFAVGAEEIQKAFPDYFQDQQQRTD